LTCSVRYKVNERGKTGRVYYSRKLNKKGVGPFWLLGWIGVFHDHRVRRRGLLDVEC